MVEQKEGRGINIYPFVDEVKGLEAYVRVLRWPDEEAKIVSNCNLQHITREKWSQFKAAVDRAFEIVDELERTNTFTT